MVDVYACPDWAGRGRGGCGVNQALRLDGDDYLLGYDRRIMWDVVLVAHDQLQSVRSDRQLNNGLGLPATKM